MAANLLEKYHGHRDFELWDTDKTLIGTDKRFQSSNGGLSEEQLTWLANELDESDLKKEIVIVFGHVGLSPQSCGPDSLLWNYQQVIDCFNAHSCVVAYFSGHAHNSGYAFHHGIHYVVYHGIIETNPESEAFATVTLFEDRMLIDGKGVEQQLNLHFNPAIFSHTEKTAQVDESTFAENSSAIEESMHMVEIKVNV